MNVIIQYFLALTITVSAEFVIYWIFIRKKPLQLLAYSILINSLTLPIANYGYHNVLENFFAIELLVVFVESVLIFLLLKQKYPRSLLISSVANFITALMSLLF